MSIDRVPAGERRIPGRLPGGRTGVGCPYWCAGGSRVCPVIPSRLPTLGTAPVPGGGKVVAADPGAVEGTNDTGVVPNFRGRLKQMDAKSIALSLDDDRVLDFKRTDKTKFFKNGEELKTPDFKPGDQISIEGPEDQRGYMTAVNVYWEKAAAAAGSQEKKEGGVDAWAVTPPHRPRARR